MDETLTKDGREFLVDSLQAACSMAAAGAEDLVNSLQAAYSQSKPGAEEIVIEQLLKTAVEIQQTLARLQQGR